MLFPLLWFTFENRLLEIVEPEFSPPIDIDTHPRSFEFPTNEIEFYFPPLPFLFFSLAIQYKTVVKLIVNWRRNERNRSENIYILGGKLIFFSSLKRLVKFSQIRFKSLNLFLSKTIIYDWLLALKNSFFLFAWEIYKKK